MLVKESKSVYQYIPEVWQKVIEEEALAAYEAFARAPRTIPCLDESIVNRLAFYHLAICYYNDNNGEVIDEGWLSDANKWNVLNKTYPIEEYAEEFLSMREDVKVFLDVNNIFYEENWLYTILPSDYECVIKNSPIKMVW